MIKLDHVLISDEVRDERFVCHLEKCKGACCVEGELGAPLEEEELPVLKEIYPFVNPTFRRRALKPLKRKDIIFWTKTEIIQRPPSAEKNVPTPFMTNKAF